MSTDIKLPRAQKSKIIQSGGFLGSSLSKLAGALMKVVVPLAKNILAPLGITTAASATDAGIQNKIHGSGRLLNSPSQTTTLIISNEEMSDILKIFQALDDSHILMKQLKIKQLKMKQKNKKEDF